MVIRQKSASGGYFKLINYLFRHHNTKKDNRGTDFAKDYIEFRLIFESALQWKGIEIEVQ
jgi:hypothetical protein